MDKDPREKDVKVELISRKVRAIIDTLRQLDQNEIHEWKRLQILKITQISSKLSQ